MQAAVRRQLTPAGPGTGEWRHHMNHVLGAVAAVAPPQNAQQLLETLARIWADKPGGRTRQIQIQLMAIDQRITHVSIHQRAGALQLSSAEIRPVPQHGRHPLLMNLVAPASSVEIRER